MFYLNNIARGSKKKVSRKFLGVRFTQTNLSTSRLIIKNLGEFFTHFRPAPVLENLNSVPPNFFHQPNFNPPESFHNPYFLPFGNINNTDFAGIFRRNLLGQHPNNGWIYTESPILPPWFANLTSYLFRGFRSGNGSSSGSNPGSSSSSGGSSSGSGSSAIPKIEVLLNSINFVEFLDANGKIRLGICVSYSFNGIEQTNKIMMFGLTHSSYFFIGRQKFYVDFLPQINDQDIDLNNQPFPQGIGAPVILEKSRIINYLHPNYVNNNFNADIRILAEKYVIQKVKIINILLDNDPEFEKYFYLYEKVFSSLQDLIDFKNSIGK